MPNDSVDFLQPAKVFFFFSFEKKKKKKQMVIELSIFYFR